MYMYVCLVVCLSVCLSARISQRPHVQTSQNFLYIIPVAVARSSSDGVMYKSCPMSIVATVAHLS